MNSLFLHLGYLLFFIGPVSIFIHEMGHAIGAMLEKAYPIKVHIGKGRKLLQLHINCVTIVVYRWYFLGGITAFSRNLPYNRWKAMFTSLAGPLCNLFVAFILLAVYLYGKNDHFLLGCLFNSWLFLANVVPYKWRGSPSDGYSAMDTARFRK